MLLFVMIVVAVVSMAVRIQAFELSGATVISYPDMSVEDAAKYEEEMAERDTENPHDNRLRAAALREAAAIRNIRNETLAKTEADLELKMLMRAAEFHEKVARDEREAVAKLTTEIESSLRKIKEYETMREREAAAAAQHRRTLLM